MTHYLTGLEFDQATVRKLLNLAENMKKYPAEYCNVLAGKSIVTLFEKPSLRTRLSFDIGINKLGGHAVYLDQQNGAIGSRESVKDFAMNISTWADGLVARVNQHSTLETLAQHASIPVVNSLCDLYHPCQAMADFLTIQEVLGDVSKVKLAYLGDGNNVSHSLLLLGATLGTDVVIVTPKGFSPDAQVVKQAEDIAKQSGAKIVISDRIEAVYGADVLYTDTWISMGSNLDLESIQAAFSPYQINQALVDNSGASCVLHCQPAHREIEITSQVMDSAKSKIIQQAENRMHAQNALLLHLFQNSSS